jgi:hypothetical protein
MKDGQGFDAGSDPDPTLNLGQINDQFKSEGSSSMCLKVFPAFPENMHLINNELDHFIAYGKFSKFY